MKMSVVTVMIYTANNINANAPPHTLLCKNSFFRGYLVEEALIKNWGQSRGKGYLYIKDWFKPILLLSIT